MSQSDKIDITTFKPVECNNGISIQHYTISLLYSIVWILTYWYGKKIDDSDKVTFGYFLVESALFRILQLHWRYYGSVNGLYDFQILKELPLQLPLCLFLAFACNLYANRYSLILDILWISGAFLELLHPE